MTTNDVDEVNELDSLLGAYALDAVDDDERRRVERYLRSNPRAAAEVSEHREVATMLAFTGMDAPAGLWSKIAAEIDSDAPEPGPELAKVFALDGNERRRETPWMLAAAAALVVALVGAVAILGFGARSSDDPVADAYERAVDDQGSLQAELVADGSTATAVGVIDPNGRGYLDAGDLPALGDEQTYQLWGVLADSGDVVSLGILGPRPDLETFTVDGAVAALAVTIERSPGVVSDGNPDGAYVGPLG